MAYSGPVTPATVVSVSPPPQAQAPPPPPSPTPGFQPVTEPEQEEQPARVVAVDAASYPQCQPPAMMSPQPQITAPQLPLMTASQQLPGVYAPRQDPYAFSAAPMPAPAPVLPAQPAPLTTVMQLQVLVPHPGLNPGQQLAFPAPMGPGQPPKQMVVKVQHGAAPGAVVTVQYPVPATAPGAPGQALPSPPPVFSMQAQADHNAAVAGWMLFGAGWICLCVFPPLGLCLWGLGSALYFCKPPQRRVQLRESRTPAYANLIVCVGCVLFALIVVLLMSVAALADDPDFQPAAHHHPHHHHHGKFLGYVHPEHRPAHHPWEQRANWTEQDVTAPAKKRCPWARLKAIHQKMMRQAFGRNSPPLGFAKPKWYDVPPAMEAPQPASEATDIFT